MKYDGVNLKRTLEHGNSVKFVSFSSNNLLLVSSS